MALSFNTGIGKLRITEVLLEYDGPNIFACTDPSGQRYLCALTSWDGHETVWLLTKMTRADLRLVGDGVMSLREAFVGDRCATVLVARGGPAVTVAKVTEVPCAELPPDYMPRAGARLGPPAPAHLVATARARRELRNTARQSAPHMIRNADCQKPATFRIHRQPND